MCTTDDDSAQCNHVDDLLALCVVIRPDWDIPAICRECNTILGSFRLIKSVLRSAVGMTHVFRERLVMGYADY